MKRNRGRKKATKKGHQVAAPSPPPSGPYNVDMTASAEAVYANMFRKCKEAEDRGDIANLHCTNFRMVRDAVKKTIPQDPINKQHALTGDLSNIFRVQKGRMRICWIASSKLRRICILYISESLRKAGDVHDPYRVFAGMVMSGQFNEFFERLGSNHPVLR